jgi:hypothetical protein
MGTHDPSWIPAVRLQTLPPPNDPEGLGLVLKAFRASDAPTSNADVSHSVYVIPTANKLPVESRLLMSLYFDQPFGEMTSGEDSSKTTDRMRSRDLSGVQKAPGSIGGYAFSPEPWAVGVKVKKFATRAVDPQGNPIFVDTQGDPFIGVTCQFRSTGVRLNTPSALQQDGSYTATDLNSPLNYDQYQGPQPADHDAPPTSHSVPTPFVLQFLFCGVQAVPNPPPPRNPLGYAVGWGFLSIGTKSDQRVFSRDSLWELTFPLDTIAAFGASVATQTGNGTFGARLRTFAVDLWPAIPVSPIPVM